MSKHVTDQPERLVDVCDEMDLIFKRKRSGKEAQESIGAGTVVCKAFDRDLHIRMLKGK